jgi:iron complex outermembrane receptor protein
MRAWRLVSGFAAACFLAKATVAQVPGPTAGAAQTVPGLEEVTVTAQKRPENIQTVPLSIVAFSAESLRQLGMTEAFDLANQVPNMNIDAPSADSNVRYFLRGVGTQDFNTLAMSPIALYVDDVYLGSTIANSVNSTPAHLRDQRQHQLLSASAGTRPACDNVRLVATTLPPQDDADASRDMR